MIKNRMLERVLNGAKSYTKQRDTKADMIDIALESFMITGGEQAI